MFDKKKIAKAFMVEANDDIKSAEIMLKDRYYSKVVYFCQQAVEKILKAALIMKNIVIAEHKISGIFVKNFKEMGDIEKIKKAAEFLEKQGVKPRSPLFTRKDLPIWIPSRAYKEKDAKEALKNTNFILEKITKFLKDKFSIN